MTGALIILGVTVAFGLLLFWSDGRRRDGDSSEVKFRSDGGAPGDKLTSGDGSEGGVIGDEGHSGGGICCGMHAVCEKLASPYVETPVYYEDEELDRYRGREADEYTEEETDEFREVLMTMREEEVKGWLESLERRGVALPEGLRDEVGLLLQG